MNVLLSVALPLLGLALGWTARWLYARFQLTSAEQRLPPLNKIKIIAKALNVKVSDLLEDNNNQSNSDIDIYKFDTRSLKKLKDILSLPANDRADLYRMLNKMLRKNQLELEKSTNKKSPQK
ncbi:hypothetical protein [Spirochaeta thermophila]|uniref:hypothetical protein n=1 Tax=Winmispira thermophila TaxID=154 RepID=UPI0011D08D61|nr:hypothetical protein [Spirochaeta thermophila]